MQKNTANPEWNEKLTLTELFPPLCQRIKIELKCSDSFNNSLCAVHYMNIRAIANDGENGFLPTFGPSFVYFYSQDIYVGKVLLSVTTEIQEDAMCCTKSVAVESISGLNEVLR